MVQTWNSDSVTVYETKESKTPNKYNILIINDVMGNLKVMQLAKYEEMTDKEKKFGCFAEGPGAYWAGEGEKIQMSRPKWLQVTMVVKKPGVIIPVSREYLHYKMSDFFTVMQPKIAEVFYKKFDTAALLNTDNPSPQSLEESIVTAVNAIKGPLIYDNILALEDVLGKNKFEPNASTSNRKNCTELRSVTQAVGTNVGFIYDRSANTIDGLPVVDLKALGKDELYAGDSNYIFYGIPFNISFKTSEDVQLSTLKSEDGTPVDLFEQELVALHATMDVGFMIVKDAAFGKIEPVGE